MPPRRTRFRNIRCSLNDMLGKDALARVVAAQAALSGQSARDLRRLAAAKVDLYPADFHARQVAMLDGIGKPVAGVAKAGQQASIASGAGGNAFDAATDRAAAPLAAYGYYRVGEDGTLRCITKAEHYHVSVGHAFPGLRLLEHARQLGVPNATHNNTRGQITRRLEQELIRLAHGLDGEDSAGLERVRQSRRAHGLNRVLNLQSGSLAAEAALKLLLARFYYPQADTARPVHAGKTPVFLVMGDDDGQPTGNYHGTCVTAQMLRGMWPELAERTAGAGMFEVHAIRPNSREDLEAAFQRYQKGPRRLAGFIHEIIMMNYGGRRLTPAFLRRAYTLCRRDDVPTVVDEIQSCIWSPQVFLFREYGLKPDAVVLGKGMSGGEYAASRLLLSPELDLLPQFGALVTNGQEEIASLAYLVCMRWAEANGDITEAVGRYYEERLGELAQRYRHILNGVDGCRHLMALVFDDLPVARRAVRLLTEAGLDISVQTYKANCPPAALTKLPITFGYEAVDAMVQRIDDVLGTL